MASASRAPGAPTSDTFDLTKYPVHLGLGASAVPQPEHTGAMEWYMEYGSRHGADGIEGRLVSMHTFDTSWDTWEMHPNGHELVIVTAGSVTLVQEIDGEHRRNTLTVGQVAINPPGVWHTAEVTDPVTALFVTAGVGTEIRPV